jgi:hypothetical protein
MENDKERTGNTIIPHSADNMGFSHARQAALGIQQCELDGRISRAAVGQVGKRSLDTRDLVSKNRNSSTTFQDAIRLGQRVGTENLLGILESNSNLKVLLPLQRQRLFQSGRRTCGEDKGVDRARGSYK